MTPYYADPWLTVYQGDARAVLAELPARREWLADDDTAGGHGGWQA